MRSQIDHPQIGGRKTVFPFSAKEKYMNWIWQAAVPKIATLAVEEAGRSASPDNPALARTQPVTRATLAAAHKGVAATATWRSARGAVKKGPCHFMAWIIHKVKKMFATLASQTLSSQ